MGYTNDDLARMIEELRIQVRELQATINGRSDSMELTKNSRGYTWSVKSYNNNEQELLAKVARLNVKLGELYGETKSEA
jgi:hypothetical protein